ncbi:MAG: glycosyltransferase family 2 protein [Actinomycetota bacterium]
MAKASSKPKIAVIIPAYNEEERISSVLSEVMKVPLIDEIIVVNDGSTDGTANAVKKHRDVTLINSETNRGKGAALKMGIDATDADILVFIDADLVGLTPKHIEDLINPLLIDDELMMTVGKFAGGRLRTDLSQTIIPFISGQRALKRQFLDGIPDFSESGFGVEIALTKHAKNCEMKVREVIINDATHVMKEEKLGFSKGLLARLKMYGDMIKHLLRL